MTATGQPFYARALRLRHIRPGTLLCALFFEGAIAVAALAALAEFASWWGIVVLPAIVALLVKLDDVRAGARSCPAPPQQPAILGRAAVPLRTVGPVERVRARAAVPASSLAPPSRRTH